MKFLKTRKERKHSTRKPHIEGRKYVRPFPGRSCGAKPARFKKKKKKV